MKEGNSFLCKAWGETTYTSVAIVDSLEAVRQFFIDQWLGSADHVADDGTNTLEAAMTHMQQFWTLEGDAAEWGWVFEIGGVSVKKCDNVSPPDPQIAALTAEVAAFKEFADLWYFVMDEAPMKFQKIIEEWSPARWMGEAFKLMKEKRK